MTAQDLIRHLGLQPLPTEGGYFRETYRASEHASSLPSRYAGTRAFSTAIYSLLTSEAGCFSALHRLQTDEVYHFYLGDALELLLLHPDGRGESVILGQDVLGGQRLQYVVPCGAWQGSRLVPGGRFALLGTTMSPGFDRADFELGSRDELVRAYPQHAALITHLTR